MSTYQNHLEVKTGIAEPSSFLYSMSQYELIIFISNKFPGDVATAVLGTTLLKTSKIVQTPNKYYYQEPPRYLGTQARVTHFRVLSITKS